MYVADHRVGSLVKRRRPKGVQRAPTTDRESRGNVYVKGVRWLPSDHRLPTTAMFEIPRSYRARLRLAMSGGSREGGVARGDMFRRGGSAHGGVEHGGRVEAVEAGGCERQLAIPQHQLTQPVRGEPSGQRPVSVRSASGQRRACRGRKRDPRSRRDPRKPKKTPKRPAISQGRQYHRVARGSLTEEPPR
eukprot:1584771-Pyramimonas_sp.AAC.1